MTDATNGEALAGVTVVVTSSGTTSQSAITDGKGAYKIADLAPGDYLVTFYYLDATVERSNVRVGVQKVTPVFQKMNAQGGSGEVVKVTSRAPAIDPTSTAQGITIDSDYLKNIPVPGRTYAEALGAAAGSQGDRLGVAFSGSTSLENQYYVDGVNTTGMGYGTIESPVINDFIEEIEIITGGYNAEYGRATGGIVNVVTKSGSNELKGSVFATWQPGLLTAPVKRTPVNATSIDLKADVGYHADVGFELGGPVIKDKLWFFVGFAPTFQRIDYTRDVKRQTDCHVIGADGAISGCDARLAGNGGNADGIPDIDPSTGFYLTDIVDSEIRAQTEQSYQMLGKLNYAQSANQQGQLSIQARPSTRRTPGLLGPATSGADFYYNPVDIAAKWTSKLDDGNTEIEAVVGIHREHYELHGLDRSLDAEPMQVLQNGNLGVLGAGFGESPQTQAGCRDTPPGGSDAYPLITNCPMVSRSYTIGGPGGLYDDTYPREAARIGITQRVKRGGSHELKAGVDAENMATDHARVLSGGAFVQNQIGTQVDVVRLVRIGEPMATDTSFDQTCSTPVPGGDMTDRLDYPCTYLPGQLGASGSNVQGRTFNWAGYLRDSWQIRPNLTLNAGLRYEEQRLAYADFLQNTIDLTTGERRGKNALTLRGEVAPRVGVLYDWTREGRSKAYAHWGRFYESIPMELNDLSFGNPIEYVRSYTPSRCGMSDPRIGGPNGNDCTTTMATPDLREELFGVNGSLIAPGIRGQYLDEMVAGVELELIDDLKLGVSFQDRRYGRIIEDVSTDGANTYVIANPGEWSSEEETKFQQRIDRTTDPVLAAKLQHELELLRGIRIFDPGRRDYDALQFTALRRFAKSLYAQASYTYARTRGNYAGLLSYDDNFMLPNNSPQYDSIELLANRMGPLPQDRPHYIKLDGYYKVDLKKRGELTAGIRFRAFSGTPRSAQGPHYRYGGNFAFLLPRGELGRSDFEHGLDVHVGYRRALSRNMHAEVYVDVYNVYDNQGTAAVDSSYALFGRQSTPGEAATTQGANPISGGTYDDLLWAKVLDRDAKETTTPLGRNPNFGNTTQRYAPAYARIGARVTF